MLFHSKILIFYKNLLLNLNHTNNTMKTINIIGVTILAPLAAAFFILTIGFKTAQALTQFCFQSSKTEVEHNQAGGDFA
jgi:hypothetical protein